MVSESLNYIFPPSPSLFCAICHDIFEDPVISTICFHSFCSPCLHQCLVDEGTCPLCRSRMTENDIHPNLALRSVIGELRAYCPFQSKGCSEQVTKDTIHIHALECDYKESQCHNSLVGCSFKGFKKDVATHQTNCSFDSLKEMTSIFSKRLAELEDTVKRQSMEIEKLKCLKMEISTTALDFEKPSAEISGQETEDSDNEEQCWPRGEIGEIHKLNAEKGVTSLAFSIGCLFCGFADGSVQVYNYRGTFDPLIKYHDAAVWSLVCDEDLEYLYSASSDGTIKRFLVTDMLTLCETVSDHEGKVYSLALKDSILLSGSSDKTIKLWTVDDCMTCTSTLQGHSGGINSLDTIDFSSQVVSGSSDKTMKIWDITTGACVQTFDEFESEVLQVAAGESLLFSSTYDASIACFDLRSHEKVAVLSGHSWEVWQLQYHDGVLFSGSFDHTIKRWDLRTFQDTATLRGHKGFVHAMCIGNGELFSGGADKSIRVWS